MWYHQLEMTSEIFNVRVAGCVDMVNLLSESQNVVRNLPDPFLANLRRTRMDSVSARVSTALCVMQSRRCAWVAVSTPF